MRFFFKNSKIQRLPFPDLYDILLSIKFDMVSMNTKSLSHINLLKVSTGILVVITAITSLIFEEIILPIKEFSHIYNAFQTSPFLLAILFGCIVCFSNRSLRKFWLIPLYSFLMGSFGCLSYIVSVLVYGFIFYILLHIPEGFAQYIPYWFFICPFPFVTIYYGIHFIGKIFSIKEINRYTELIISCIALFMLWALLVVYSHSWIVN